MNLSYVRRVVTSSSVSYSKLRGSHIEHPTSTSRSILNRHRLNHRIEARALQVVASDGKLLGHLRTESALDLAAAEGLDLVEVNPHAHPPVCRIMDYGKYRFQLQKKSTNAKRNPRRKQLRIRFRCSAHDIQVKVDKARQLLTKQHSVELSLQFRGRETIYHQRGQAMLRDFASRLHDVAVVKSDPKLESKTAMTLLLAPTTKQ